VGKTGVGKSATANTISGGDYFKSGLCAQAVTQICQQQKVTRFGKDISIIDTPGIFDAGTNQREVQKEIRRCVHLGAPGLRAILYVIEIGRIRNEDIKTMRTFLKFFGKEMENRVIVVFTHGDQLVKEKQTLSGYLENLADDIKQFLNICKDRTIVFNNNFDKDQRYEQVSSILLMIEQLKISNVFAFYSDDVFKKAEEQVQQREEEIREMVEKEYKEKTKQFELEMASMQERLETLSADYEEKVKNLREEVRKEINPKKAPGELIFHIHVLTIISEHIKQNNLSNTTGATSGAETAYPFGASEFTPGF
jgi:predicted GTPase